MELRPTSSGGARAVPGARANLAWLERAGRARREPRRRERRRSVLNLFAHTGLATLAAARAGAAVAHVDAARGAVAWARRNAELSGLADRPGPLARRRRGGVRRARGAARPPLRRDRARPAELRAAPGGARVAARGRAAGAARGVPRDRRGRRVRAADRPLGGLDGARARASCCGSAFRPARAAVERRAARRSRRRPARAWTSAGRSRLERRDAHGAPFAPMPDDGAVRDREPCEPADQGGRCACASGASATRPGLTLVDGGREALRAIEAGAIVETAFVCPPLIGSTEAQAGRREARPGLRAVRRVDRASSRSASARSSGWPTAIERTASSSSCARRGSGARGPRAARTTRSSSSPRTSRSPATWARSSAPPTRSGADAVIAVGGTDLFNPNVIRASVGTVFTMPVAAAPRRRGHRVAARAAASGSSRPASTPTALHVDADLTRAASRSCSAARPTGLSDAWRGAGRRGRPPADGRRRRQPQRLRRRGGAAVRGVAPASTPHGGTADDRHDGGTRPRTFDFVIIGAGPGRRVGRVRGAPSRRERRDRRSALVRRQLPAHRLRPVEVDPRLAPRATTRTRRLVVARRRPSAATGWSIGRPTPTSRTTRRTSRRSRRPARSSTAATARIPTRGVVEVRHDGADPSARGRERRRRGRLDLEGPAHPGPRRRSRSGPIARRPSLASCRGRLLVLGGGPTGCELAQAYARFGVPVTIVQSGDRLTPTDHPRNSAVDDRGAPRGRRRRPARRVARSRRAPAAARTARTSIDLSDGSTAEGHAILLAVGREFPLDDLGLECYGVDTTGRTPFPRDGRLRDRRRPVGDRRPGRPGAAHPPGPLPGRGRGPDGARRRRHARLPRAAARVVHGSRGGVRRASASSRRRPTGIDAVEFVADFATSARGYARPGEARPRDGRLRPRVADAGRRRDGLPGRLRRDPRMRPRDSRPRAGRRPRRHDPRLPLDLAHPQRPLRRRPPGALVTSPCPSLTCGEWNRI